MREMLRKAGKRILDADEAYAKRVEKDMGGAHKAPIKTMLGGAPMRSIGYDRSEAKGFKEHAIGSAFVAGVGATNLGYRYGLPAAGVTLAGKAIIDLTSAFGGAADQPEPNTLTL